MSQLVTGDDWAELSDGPLPVEEVLSWVARPSAGGIVVFVGAVRDNSEGRPGVHTLAYEAYEEQVEPRLGRIAAEARRRWPDVARLAMLHRTGTLAVGEPSVVVAASAPHREQAFRAARYCIDTLKTTVPIWKRESWEGGSDWASCAQPVEDAGC